ncbi:MAG: InlB B-repeat-containing protein, partial [Thermoplasmatales archaeon]|nr:InlB B-repeat-containing protein [Thermoplasmatales archaeon]
KHGGSAVDWPHTLVADVTFVAQWTVNEYTITFETGEGGSAVPAITQDYGTAVSAPGDPTRAGYTFAGWSPEVPGTMPLDGGTCVAQWTPRQYTITFETGEGGSAVAPITQDYGTAVTAPEAPTKVGHTFDGWDPALPVTMPAKNATHKAKWKVNEYSITFNSAGGSAVPAITQDYGIAVTPPADPTKEGYIFAGWQPALPATMPVDGLACVAQWEAEAGNCSITFNPAGGSYVAPIVGAPGTAVTAPEAPTKVGHTFDGWDPALPETMPAENATHRALWTVIEYTITFDSAGGSAVDSITVGYGSAVVAPDDPVRAGYVFVRWDPALPETMPAENLAVVAAWTIDAAAGTYDVLTSEDVASALGCGDNPVLNLLGDADIDMTTALEGFAGDSVTINLPDGGGSWSFSGDKVADAGTFRPAVSLTAATQDMVDASGGFKNAMYMEFSASGKMPFANSAFTTAKAEWMENGKEYDVYLWDADAKEFVKQEGVTAVVADGKVTVALGHCSVYALSEPKDSGGDTPGGDTPGGDTPGDDTPGGDTPGGSSGGGSGNTGLYAGAAIAVLAAIAVVALFVYPGILRKR